MILLHLGHCQLLRLLRPVQEELLTLAVQFLVLQAIGAIDEHPALDTLQLDVLLLIHIVAIQHLAHGIAVGQFCQLLFCLGLGCIVGFPQSVALFLFLVSSFPDMLFMAGEQLYVFFGFIQAILGFLYVGSRGAGILSQPVQLFLPGVHLRLPVGQCVIGRPIVTFRLSAARQLLQEADERFPKAADLLVCLLGILLDLPEDAWHHIHRV